EPAQSIIAVLRQAVAAAAKEFQASKVAEDLELLADFVVDVGVVRMELGEGGGVGVDIGKLEFRFVQRLNHLQRVRSLSPSNLSILHEQINDCSYGRHEIVFFPVSDPGCPATAAEGRSA